MASACKHHITCQFCLLVKPRCIILIFSIFKAFLISSAGSLLPSKKSKNIFCGKNTAIIRWPLHRVTALQVVRTSSLYPRPRLFPFPPPPPRPHFPGMKQLEDWLITGLAIVSSPTECGVYCRSPFSVLEYSIPQKCPSRAVFIFAIASVCTQPQKDKQMCMLPCISMQNDN